MPTPCPSAYHHVLNQKNVAQVSAGNRDQRREKSQKRHRVAQEKSAADTPRRHNLWAHAASGTPVQSTVHQLYSTCTPGFREPSSVSDVESPIHWSSFQMYLPTVSKIQSALKCVIWFSICRAMVNRIDCGPACPCSYQSCAMWRQETEKNTDLKDWVFFQGG